VVRAAAAHGDDSAAQSDGLTKIRLPSPPPPRLLEIETGVAPVQRRAIQFAKASSRSLQGGFVTGALVAAGATLIIAAALCALKKPPSATAPALAPAPMPVSAPAPVAAAAAAPAPATRHAPAPSSARISPAAASPVGFVEGEAFVPAPARAKSRSARTPSPRSPAAAAARS